MAQPNNPASTAARTAAAKRFQHAVEPAKRRLVLSVYGKEKEGKTHFAFTAPGPLGYIGIDNGHDGVVQKFQDNKNIEISKYRLKIPPKGADMAQVTAASNEMWDDIHEDLYYSLEEHRSTVVDTADEIWAVLRLARFGKLDQVKPHHYGPVNSEFRDLFREAYDHNSNLILLHKVKKEYINDNSTGRYERAGFSETGFLVQVEINCYRLDPKERDDDGDNGFRADVISCRQNPDLVGETLSGPLLSFPMLAQMVFPDSDESDWI